MLNSVYPMGKETDPHAISPSGPERPSEGQAEIQAEQPCHIQPDHPKIQGEPAGSSAEEVVRLPDALGRLMRELESGQFLEEWSQLPWLQRMHVASIVRWLHAAFEAYAESDDERLHEERGEELPLGPPSRLPDAQAHYRDEVRARQDYLPDVDHRIAEGTFPRSSELKPASPIHPFAVEQEKIAATWGRVYDHIERRGGLNKACY